MNVRQKPRISAEMLRKLLPRDLIIEHLNNMSETIDFYHGEVANMRADERLASEKVILEKTFNDMERGIGHQRALLMSQLCLLDEPSITQYKIFDSTYRISNPNGNPGKLRGVEFLTDEDKALFTLKYIGRKTFPTRS